MPAYQRSIIEVLENEQIEENNTEKGERLQSSTNNKKKNQEHDAEILFNGDENHVRGNWSGKVDFFLSTVGYAVGLGNVWRFPYIAYSNGGASFLIPYVIMLVFCGLPLFYMEMALGQFSSLGPISVWKVVPAVKGIGYAMVMVSGFVAIYYNMIIAYTLFYFFASLNTEVPWQNCRPDWIQNNSCVDRMTSNESLDRDAYCLQLLSYYPNHVKEEDNPEWVDYFRTCLAPRKSPSQVYWETEVLNMSEGIDMGGADFSWKLVLSLLLAWVFIFCCLCKGIKSSGKVVYFTATFPYVVLVILFIRNITLDGAWVGIKFYMVPDFYKLADPKVWYTAAVQIFYSLGVGFGGLETMASYNSFRNNIQRDAVLVALINCGTSVFAGFVIFSVMGFMASHTGQPIETVANVGSGLAFVAYPEGIAMMPGAPIWSCLFFLMLFTLGLDSQFAMMETIVSALYDEFYIFQKGKHRKTLLTLVLCIILFTLGLPQCARNGTYILELLDSYCSGFTLIIITLIETISIAWIYGFSKFSDDIKMMIGSKPNIYWEACWKFVTPLGLFVLLCFTSVFHKPPNYGESYIYPGWAEGIGWFLVALAMITIPVTLIIEYITIKTEPGRNRLSFKTLLYAKSDWGPALEKHRTGRYNNPIYRGLNQPSADHDRQSYRQNEDVELPNINGNGDLPLLEDREEVPQSSGLAGISPNRNAVFPQTNNSIVYALPNVRNSEKKP